MDLTNPGFKREDAAVQLHWAEILDSLGGDWWLTAELCDMALVELPHLSEQLAAALRAQDAYSMQRAAHRLKGILSAFGKGPHLDAAEALEQMARNQALAQASEALNRLNRYLAEFMVAAAELEKQAHVRAGGR